MAGNCFGELFWCMGSVVLVVADIHLKQLCRATSYGHGKSELLSAHLVNGKQAG